MRQGNTRPREHAALVHQHSRERVSLVHQQFRKRAALVLQRSLESSCQDFWRFVSDSDQ